MDGSVKYDMITGIGINFFGHSHSEYMGEVIDENGLAGHIRYRHRINAASWSSETKLWTIEATDRGNGEAKTFTANFLWMCQGYYRHSEGYTPEWKGMEDFKGRISERDDKNYSMQAYAEMSIGAVRMEEEKVVQVLCKDT